MICWRSMLISPAYLSTLHDISMVTISHTRLFVLIIPAFWSRTGRSHTRRLNWRRCVRVCAVCRRCDAALTVHVAMIAMTSQFAFLALVAAAVSKCRFTCHMRSVSLTHHAIGVYLARFERGAPWPDVLCLFWAAWAVDARESSSSTSLLAIMSRRSIQAVESKGGPLRA